MRQRLNKENSTDQVCKNTNGNDKTAGDNDTKSERHDKDSSVTDTRILGMKCNTSWSECGSSEEAKGQQQLKIRICNKE